MMKEQKKSSESTQAIRQLGQESEDLLLKRRLQSYAKFLGVNLTKKLAMEVLAPEGWETYEGEIPSWVEKLK